MIFSYNFLQSFFAKKLPAPKKLAELLTFHSFEVETIKKAGKDWVFDIDIMPNRPDCFSHLGIARECGAILNTKYQTPSNKLKEDKGLDIKKLVELDVKSSNDCPRYTGRMMTGVKVKASPKWLRERLMTCGLQSINNIVDAANYVMLEIGQPLHVFDFDKVEGGKIVVRRARKGEKLDALDDKNYALNKDVLVIADSEKPLAIAGIKGGVKAAINKKTKNIFIESANFGSKTIRHASQGLELKTDASFRFEHGIDPEITEFAIDRVAGLIQEIASGKVAKGMVDAYLRKRRPRILRFDITVAERLLGLKIPKNKIIAILKSLEIEVSSSKGKILDLKIPTWRRDLALPVDIAEEVIRIYGLEKVRASMPWVVLSPLGRNDEIFWESQIKNILKESGFSEVYGYSFISKKDAKIYPFDLIELENPISEEFQYLRPNLVINLLKFIRLNLKNYRDIKIFESGKSFRQARGNVREKKMLAGMVWSEKEDESFYFLKGVLDSLFQKLGISNYYFDEYQATPEDTRASFWHKRKIAEIRIGKKEIGFLGEVSLKVLDAFNIPRWVFAFDIDFEKLVKECREECEYRPVSRFPTAVRDIAVLVPSKIKVVEVLNIINRAGGRYVRDVDLFDLYEGPELPSGKKNLAFHIMFQAEDKTLGKEEIDEIYQKIVRAIEKRPGWEVRR